MKKILSIALVAALLVSSVFAVSFTGDATLSLGYDLDTKDYGFGNGTTTTLKFGFELGSGDGASAGEGDLRAEIAGTFKVEFKETKYTAKVDLKAATISTLKISKANILYKDFLTIGILSAGESADYAKSYYSINSDGDKLDVLPTFNDVPGFTYKVAAEKFAVSGGIGFNGNSEAETYNVLAYAGLDDFAVADGVKFSVAAGTKITDAYKGVAANLKGSYENDKFSASFGTDFLAYIGEEAIGLEAALAAKYDFVSLDVYYYTVDKFEKNNLDAKLAASYTLEGDVTVTVKGSFEGQDILNQQADGAYYTAQEFVPALEASCTIDAFTIGANASYGIMGKKFSAGANVAYKHDMFTAKAAVNFATVFGTDNSSSIYASASIESTKLINGATVSLAYAPAKVSNKVVTNYFDKDTKLGKVTAAVKVAF